MNLFINQTDVFKREAAMKRIFKQMLGVTLLEILLVLAVAATIIILSVRYYQSSASSQQANAAIEQIQAIASAMDNIANGGAGSYSGITSATLAAVLGSANLNSPTNAPIVYTPGDATTYSISMPLNPGVCTAVLAKISGNTKITSPACDSAGTLTYTYNSTT